MNRFLQAMLFGPPCPEIFDGAVTEPRPITDSERELNLWRREQYQQRLAAHVRRQGAPEEAEKAVTRRFETGLIILAAWKARWSRRRGTAVRPVLQLASRRAAH